MANKKEEATEPTLEVVKTPAQEQVERLSEERGTPEIFRGRTAHDVVATVGFSDVAAADRAQLAADAGVVHPAYVDYEEALQQYEARPDVETLADRRARENGTSFGDAAFRRQVSDARNPGLVVSNNAGSGTKNDQVEQVNDRPADK